VAFRKKYKKIPIFHHFSAAFAPQTHQFATNQNLNLYLNTPNHTPPAGMLNCSISPSPSSPEKPKTTKPKPAKNRP
jgi:hypothetical protein